MPKLTIDGKEIEVAAGTSVLQACEQAGIEIPRFCYHDRLSVAGSCRMCLVEVEKAPKPVASCTQPCADGMIVHTDTPTVKNARKGVMELLLINHPLDCPICDQGGECDLQDLSVGYGMDKGRYRDEKRAVSDKYLGPLVKTVMTRCIHCTRCVRFMDEIAGTPELGGLFRGEHLEIDTWTGQPLKSELSGNLVDICPVGALTNRPHAFRARSWEMDKTDSVDVLDAVGSNIRIDSKNGEVMRIVPRRNDAINDEWINDKTRHACDGLKYQRLDRPYVRGGDGKLREASWDEALAVVAAKLRSTTPERIAALAGDLADCESMFALLSFMRSLGVANTDCRQDGAVYDASARAGYIMNSGIAGIDKADAILLIGTNPRHEGTMVNARIRKRWLKGNLELGLVGTAADLGYPYRHLGPAPSSLKDIINGREAFASILRQAERPMLLLGAGVLARQDGAAIHSMAQEIAASLNMIRDGWNGFNVLQLAAARTGGLDLGFLPAANGKSTAGILESASKGEIDFVYLLGADEINMSKLGKAFVVYHGHHGDRGAHRADVVLPATAYTEKDATYVNTEGRTQTTRRAVAPVGQAKEDWAVVRAMSEAFGRPLPFNSLAEARGKMTIARPHLGDIGKIFPAEWPAEWKGCGKYNESLPLPFAPAIQNFYATDPICRASPTMAKCVEEILPLWHGGSGGKAAA